MITQKPISLKINESIYFQLEMEVSVSGTPRNRLINAAIAHYIKYLDTKRKVAVWRGTDEAIRVADDYLTEIFGKF